MRKTTEKTTLEKIGKRIEQSWNDRRFTEKAVELYLERARRIAVKEANNIGLSHRTVVSLCVSNVSYDGFVATIY